MAQSRLSDCWCGLESLNSFSSQLYEQICYVLDSADLQHLEHQALAARKRVETHLDETINYCIDPSVFSYRFQ